MNYFEKSPKTYLDFHGFASVEFSHAFDLRKGNIVSILKSMSDLKMKKKNPSKEVKIKLFIKCFLNFFYSSNKIRDTKFLHKMII